MTLTIPTDLIARHVVAGSLFALISWWAINDMPHSHEYMTNITHQLCVNGTMCAIEFSNQ